MNIKNKNMKEFEKRWNFRYKDASRNQSPEREIAKYFWRAALKWVLTNCNIGWDEYDRLTRYLEIDDDVIKNELGD